MRTAPRLLFLVTEDWYFCSHRMSLARAARDAGFAVTVATRVAKHGAAIEKEGFRLIPLGFSRRSLNPLLELAAVREIAAVYRREKPDIVHHVAVKPILYGSIAARLARVPFVVNAFTGLGYAFTAQELRGRAVRLLVTRLMRLALTGLRAKAIVQNLDDDDVLVRSGILRRGDSVLIRGSGVDLTRYAATPLPMGEPLVVLPARLIWDKGVGVFVDAARALRSAGVRARFALVGESDNENPAAVPAERIEAWKKEGAVEVWGRRDDMHAVFASATIACLPSFYREGLPKALLEAASCARPCVAADVPGSREAVIDGKTGYLVAPSDAEALASALRRLIEDPAACRRMGEEGRRLVEKEFSQERVAAETLAVYRSLLPREDA